MEYVTTALSLPGQVYDVTESIERRFDEKVAMPWMNKYWWLSFVFSALYLVLIFVGQKVMANRKPFDLRTALCMWSTGLAVFSIYACFKIFPLLWNLYTFGNLEYTVCDMTYTVGVTRMGIWAFLFPLSKLPELIDTVFIVLRKSKISFLHYYHHASVFIYCWYSYAFPISTGVWFGTVNYFVHGIMYSYYAVKASGRNPPKWLAKVITTIQLSQMFVGLFLNYMAIRAVTIGKPCRMDWFTVGISVFFYATYAILFGNFYYWTYIHKRQPKSTEKAQKVSNGAMNGSIHHSNGYTHAKSQ